MKKLPCHTSTETLFRHAAGALDAGFSLLVETHLELCPAARSAHAEFEAVGGVLLDELEPAEVYPDALNRALNALDAAPEPRRAPAAPIHPGMPADYKLPATLTGREITAWRWIAPGVRAARVALPEDSISRAFLLEIAAGVRVPAHGHEGDEMTCVLRGSFRDGETRYVAGDMALVDESVAHDIVIDSDVACLCLIAIEGRTRPSSWFGRLYQKFTDI